MRSVRIRFSKTGRAKYMSHLDLNRLMLRLIKKSQLPVWFTEGFNPHAYITFALPLPLGQEGLNESMDLRIEGEVGNEEIKEKLSAVLPPGFAINRVYDVADAPKTIAFALYEIELSLGEGQDADSVAQSFNELVKNSKLTALKTAKKGRKRIEKEVELNPLIAEFEAFSKEGKVNITATLAAGSNQNLNPDLLITSLQEKSGVQIEFVKTVRKDILKENFEAFE